MSKFLDKQGNQNKNALSDAEVKLTAIHLILSRKSIVTLSDELRRRVESLFRRRLIRDSDKHEDNMKVRPDEDAIEMTAIRLIVKEKTTQSLAGIDRQKAEEFFKEKLRSVKI